MLRLLARSAWLLVGLVAVTGARAEGGAAPAKVSVQVPDTLAQRLQPCMACHGAGGRASREGYLPRIAGKPQAYLYQQLLNFRDGRRANPAMASLLAYQTDAYLREIAGHFAALDLPQSPPPSQGAPGVPAALLARGQALVWQGDATRKLPACAACHGQALTGTQQAVPSLLGLPRDYLIGQLGAWQTGSRRALLPDCMAEISRKLAADEISAIATWLASQPVAVMPAAATTADRASGLRCGSIEAAR